MSVLTLDDVHMNPEAFPDRVRIEPFDGTPAKQDILAVIGPDEAGADRPIEPPDGTH